jgi:hypothetical protein
MVNVMRGLVGVFHEDGSARTAPLLVALGLVAVVSAVGFGVSLIQNGKRPVAGPASPPAQGVVGVTALRVPPSHQHLLWFRDDSTGLPFVLQATDWSGHLLGLLSISCDTCGVLPSADGQRLLIGNQSGFGSDTGTDLVISSSGTVLARVDGFEARWSDDGRYLCTLRPHHPTLAGRGQDLEVINAVTGHTRVAATIDLDPEAGPNGALILLHCGTSSNRAIVVFSSGGVRAVKVLQLSSGRTLYTREEVPRGLQCGCPITNIAVSGDGHIAAENLVTGAVTEIDVATGKQLPLTEMWSGRGPVNGLSWNGHLAVTPVGVYGFPDGTPLWQAPLPAFMLPVTSKPYSDDVLLSLWLASSAVDRPIVVHGDGTSARLPSSDFLQPPPS